MLQWLIKIIIPKMKHFIPILTVMLVSVGLVAFQNIGTPKTPEGKLKALGIVLSTPDAPKNAYVPFVQTGNLVFLSGKGPKNQDGKYITGKLGKDLSVDQGKAAARKIAIAQLSELKAGLGKLSRVKRIVKVSGFVNSAADFADHSAVIDGFSDLMVAAFGEKGRHARTAIGVSSLPFNMAVEVEVIVEVDRDK